MDNLTDQLLSHVFRNLTNLADFRNCRLVSQKWKRCVVEACQHKFHVVFPLTDSTFHAASQLKDTPVSFDIYSFTGKNNNDAWATSGIEPLLQTTQWLQFTGSKVNTEEIPRILSLARDSLKTLSFKCLKHNLTNSLLEIQDPFSSLRKLSIGYFCSKQANDRFTTFTDTLEKWNSLDCRVQLPMLESLTLYYSSRPFTPGNLSTMPLFVAVTTKDLFRNYIAIAKLLLKYKRTLKEVQIERIVVFFKCVFPHLPPPELEWTEMERGLEALDELNLNHLKLSTQGFFSGIWDTEIELFGRPKNLKSVLFNNLISHYDNWVPLIATLTSFDSRFLTTIKISFVLSRFPDPTFAINLGVLRDCTNLATLRLKINSRNRHEQLIVRNVELLPKGISVLHFENAEEHHHYHRRRMCDEILVSQQQIRWIIDNLRGLVSFRLSLVTPENPNNANENNEEGEDNIQHIIQWEEEVNIDLDTFRDLLALPKLKNLKVNMMNGVAFRFGRLNIFEQVQVARHVQGTTLEAIRNYSDLCEAAGYTTTTTTSPDFGAGHIFGFATLAIQKNQN